LLLFCCRYGKGVTVVVLVGAHLKPTLETWIACPKMADEDNIVGGSKRGCVLVTDM
jgi:hypothetical protein